MSHLLSVSSVTKINSSVIFVRHFTIDNLHDIKLSPKAGFVMKEWCANFPTHTSLTFKEVTELASRSHVMPETSSESFRTRSSLIAQNKLKVCFKPKGARFLSSSRITAGPENQRTIKTILCDMFLKYQFTVCVKPKIPFSHLIPLSLLTCIFDSFYYIAVYWISIFYIISTLYIAEKFPDSFGSRYLSFLKHYSSTEVFEKYCGNLWGALKAAIKNPEFIKVAAQNGVGKAITGTGAALVTEHIFHKAKVGQIYEYKTDQYMNDGKHSSGKPFSFKPNGPSILEKVTGRNGK